MGPGSICTYWLGRPNSLLGLQSPPYLHPCSSLLNKFQAEIYKISILTRREGAWVGGPLWLQSPSLSTLWVLHPPTRPCAGTHPGCAVASSEQPQCPGLCPNQSDLFLCPPRAEGHGRSAALLRPGVGPTRRTLGSGVGGTGLSGPVMCQGQAGASSTDAGRARQQGLPPPGPGLTGEHPGVRGAEAALQALPGILTPAPPAFWLGPQASKVQGHQLPPASSKPPLHGRWPPQ